MKKLFNNRFLFIMASSLIVLIVLIVGAFYLFDDSDDTFVKSGYVLNPLSSKVERYFFDEDVSYKENLSSMIVFKDVDEKEVSVLKDSFLHYSDGALSFLKNGAILDLGSISGTSAVTFYNITNKSIIENTSDGYIIESSKGDIKLNNFIGRINDGKYIVVGDLEAKVPGNSTNVKGEYFEIVYVEEGVVNIENKDVKFQVAAEGTLIYVGDIVIDLGDKKITKNGEDVMSITAITINGDENIEIIPKAPEVDEDESDGSGGTGGAGGTGDGTGTGEGDGTGSGAGGGTGGSGNGGTGNDNVEVERADDIIVSLKNADVGSTKIEVVFDIYNNTEEDVFTLKVTDLESGNVFDVREGIIAEEPYAFNLVSPGTRYLVTVINEIDQNKYFQKIFETKEFGIDIVKEYATNKELAFRVSTTDDSPISGASFTLWYYDEEDGIMKEVTKSDGVTPDVREIPYPGNDMKDGQLVVYSNLQSDTIYTAVLNNVKTVPLRFPEDYKFTATALTLKNPPDFKNLKAEAIKEEEKVVLSVGEVIDKDNAIVSYTYKIYENGKPDKTVIPPITKTNASPVEVEVGLGDGKLRNDTNYYYELIIEYFDNEKYIEYVREERITFVMGGEPIIKIVQDSDKTTHDTIAATITLIDNSCVISMPGRDCIPEGLSNASTTWIDVKWNNPITGKNESVSIEYPKLVDFNVSPDGETIEYPLYVPGLRQGTSYYISVRSDRNNTKEIENEPIFTADGKDYVMITTKTLSSFNATITDLGSTPSHPINATVQLSEIENSGTLPFGKTAEQIEMVVLELYENNVVDDLSGRNPIASLPFTNNDYNLKEIFYDNAFGVTSDGTFGLSVNDLKELGTDGTLKEYYTLVVKAYYDVNKVESVRIVSGSSKEIPINGSLFASNVEATVTPTPIVNANSDFDFGLQNDETPHGYTAILSFVKDKLGTKLSPLKANLYVYNEDGDKVQFGIKNSDGALDFVDVLSGSIEEVEYFESRIYLDYGQDYHLQENDDGITKMSRGNKYYIVIEMEVIDNETGDILRLPANINDEEAPVEYGAYALVEPEKEDPQIQMWIDKSTSDSVTYKYNIIDLDRVIYKEKNSAKYAYYYTIGEDSDEIKLELEEIDAANRKFNGSFTISDLKKNDIYTFYYKGNKLKTNSADKDIKPITNNESSRLFEGFYDAKESEYNFKYEVINNPLVDNKVTVKILADESILNRVLTYEVKFSDEKGNVLNKDVWKLSACDEDVSSDDTVIVNRCFSVDYLELKDGEGFVDEDGMKSSVSDENVITVSINAIYDNGLTGYGYTVGNKCNTEDGKCDSEFMIMQNNNTSEKRGDYVILKGEGNTAETAKWNGDVKPGYYTYSLLSNAISYVAGHKNASKNVRFTLDELGYGTNYGVFNPKMVSFDKMESDKDKFSFSSITPKVYVEMNETNGFTSMINGISSTLYLTSADPNDFCEESDSKTCVNNGSDGEYYVYIETWNDAKLVGDLSQTVRPRLKLKVNSKNTREVIPFVLDKLNNASTYYFQVYAYMSVIDDGKPIAAYKALSDATVSSDYVSKYYEFTTLSSADIFSNYVPSISNALDIIANKKDYNEILLERVEGAVYGDKVLSTEFLLSAYKNNVELNYSLAYIVCDINVSCDVNDENSYIFRSDISLDRVKANVNGKVNDIYSIMEDDLNGYNFEFADRYQIYVYAVFDYYQPSNKELTTKMLELNRRSPYFQLSPVTEPTIKVTRDAYFENGEHFFDFIVKVTDPYQTLTDGVFYLNVCEGDLCVDENNDGIYDNVVGNLMLKDGDNYVTKATDGDYHNYKFNVMTLKNNQKIRISGLKENTKYSVKIWGDAYLNNSTLSSDERFKKPENTYQMYTVDDLEVAFGSLKFGATKNTIRVTFIGGTRFDKVKTFTYTVLDSVTGVTKYYNTFDMLNTESDRQIVEVDENEAYFDFGDEQNMDNSAQPFYDVIVDIEVYDEITGITRIYSYVGEDVQYIPDANTNN